MGGTGDIGDVLGRVRMLSLDVDGVLTDGALYYTEDGGQIRKFHVRDGVGMKRVLAAGVEMALITASKTQAIRHRGEDLGIPHVILGAIDKLAALTGLCRDLGIDLAHVAHMGDDLNDVPVLEAVGCPLSVANGVPEAKDAALYVTARAGGDGAVREVCDMLVAARG
jgi:3-deoxy-D-manno-octulosonate 8-phosphate phosphatase (KDO 8-P phosphatase)